MPESISRCTTSDPRPSTHRQLTSFDSWFFWSFSVSCLVFGYRLTHPMVKWIKNEFKSRQSKVKKKNINVIIKQLVSNSMNNFELIEKREENIFHFVKIEKFIVINDKKNWLQNSREENCVVFSHSRNLKLAVWCIWRFALHSFYSTKHSEFVSGLIRFTHLQKIVKKIK